jgi:hypothetical protein
MRPAPELPAMANPCRLPTLQRQGFYGAYNQGKYSMNENKATGQINTNQAPAAKRPNETGSVSVQGFVKIFDPATQQVFVEKRA